ncbi:MAG: hypothetical protein O2973_12660 [Gemmatimonadetes bacterium]|nr:hypothetical protein [Gemmatimonadota bacterium]
MLLALTDQLRCTGAHAETWLVARADVVEEHRMVAGVLGCPVCHAERVVRGGILWWERSDSSGQEASSAVIADPDADAVMRAGALLGFAESVLPFVLCGAEAIVATGLTGLGEAPLVLLDPPDDRAAPCATIIRGAPAIPMAAGTVRGIALDTAHGRAEFIDSAVTALAQGGRLVAPATFALPAGIRELARDATHWVGERGADLIALGRAVPAR